MRRQAAATILTALLAGCGSGVPQRSASAPPTGVKTVSVAFHIAAPKKPAAGKRAPKYVSLGTQSATVDVSSPGLPTTSTLIQCFFAACTGNIDAPVATDTFTVKLYDDLNARGNLLAAGATTQNIVIERPNSVNITFDGVPAHTTALIFAVPNPLVGVKSTTVLNVNAVDAAGFTIVGPGNFDPPIDLTLKDPSGSTSLSQTTVTSPADVVTLAYNGTPKIVATVTSAVRGAAVDSTAIFEPANVSAEYAIPNLAARLKDIVQGPDGAMWLAEGDGARIGRIDSMGFVREYPTTGLPSSIIVGPDKALWFSERGRGKQYGRIAPGDDRVTEYEVKVREGTTIDGAAGLAFGTDGLLYLSNDSSTPGAFLPGVDVVAPTSGELVRSYNDLGGAAPNGIVSGPDGNIWVGTAGSVTRIGVTDGRVSSFKTAGDVIALTAGTDRNVWFTDRAGKVGNVNADGGVREFDVPSYGETPFRIVAAADGTYWFTYGFTTAHGPSSTCRLGHATTAGSVTSYAIADCITAGLAFGPDRNLWLAESSRNKIGIFSLFDTGR